MGNALGLTGGSIFELSTERYSARQLVVVSFHGMEAVSKPFSFEILVAGIDIDAATLESDLLGQPAHLRIGGEPGRWVHGIVRRVEAEATSGGRESRHRYRIWLSPRLWLLGQGRNSRIFQDLTVQQIVDRILDEHNVARRWHLIGTYAPRGYCVQHQESDLRFVRRLLAEEGIFFSFEHAEGEGQREIMVLGDVASVCVPIEGDSILEFRDSGGMVEREQDVRRFRMQHRIRPGSTLLKDFDFLRPSRDISALAEYPVPEAGFDLRRLRVYDHHGEFDGVETNETAVHRHLEQHRTQVDLGSGESRCRRLLPGRYFELHGGALPEHDGRYTVVRLEHEGHVAEMAQTTMQDVYKNRFQCIPADVPCRPKRPRRKIQQVLETATVVGPAGQEIHTDEHGRIRVQFHWDREGKRNERSSCWIRCMQAWAGTGWGFQFIPRVGMEVLVAFVLGDTDRPMVLGSVNNAEHPTAFPLPREKTKSGIKTQSTKGGGGYNELSFEDRKGYELLHVHAQKDLETVARNNHTARVGMHLTEQVGANRFAVVGGNQVIAISGNLTQAVGNDEQTTVEGSRTTRVQGDVKTSIEGRVDQRMAQDVNTSIEGRVEDRMAQDVHREIRGELIQEIRGAATMIVGRHDAKRSCTLVVEGATQLTGSEIVDLASDTEVLLRCGQSSIRIGPSEIEIASPKVTMRGKDARLLLREGEAKLKVKQLWQVVSDDKIVLKSSGASLGLGSEAKLDGKQVLLNSPDLATDEIEINEPEITKIELVDQQGNPIPYQRFRITLEDGSQYVGFVDDQGKAEVELEGAGEITFPDLVNIEES